MTPSLTLFGAPTVVMAGRRLALPPERRGRLVAYLALRRDWVGRAEVAALLWPDVDGRGAAVNLRAALHRLAQVDWAPPLEARPGSLRLVADTDVAAFEAALAAPHPGEALALRQGELLAGFEDDTNPGWSAWLARERQRLRAAWRGAVLGQLGDHVDAGTAVGLASQLLAADPLDEAAAVALLRALGRSGQTARAHRVYREFADRLQAQVGAVPNAVPLAVQQALLAAAERPPAPAPTPTPAPDDGAPAHDGFVGRQAELRRVAGLLAGDGCRLVCLLGPGGVGKTRLARRLLADLAALHADGAAWVPLEDVDSGGGLGARLARELGVPLAGNREPLEQVITALAQRRMLLVLDNAEQLVGGAAAIERLLQGCPGLKVIVTSRVRLGLAMEWLCLVDGLPCPGTGDTGRLDDFDAARLFVGAAQRVEPGLSAAAEATAIAEICRLVDGLPLALELAAGWTRLLSCEAIARELRSGSALLLEADATLPARHASIDRVFEPSWRLLSDAERSAMSALAVFRGGCTPEAAREVTGAPWPLLARLIDQSLLRKEGARLSLHPLLQQLIAARLGDGRARQAAEAAHAGHYHRLLVQQRRAAENGDRDALRLLDIEFENCRAAWRWAVMQGRTELLADSLPTLTEFVDHQGRHGDVRELLLQALDAAPVASCAPIDVLLRSHLALHESRLDRYTEAEAMAAPLLARARALTQIEAQLQCLRVLGICAMRRGRHDEARLHFACSLQLGPAEVDARNAADMLHNLAVLAAESGQPDESLRLAGQSVAMYRQLGDVPGEVADLQVLGTAHMRLGEYAASEARLRAALVLSERHGLVAMRAKTLGSMVDLARLGGDFEAAEQHARQAIDLAAALHLRGLMAGLQFDLVHIGLHRSDLAAARRALHAGMHLAVEIGRPGLQATGVAWYARILAAAGEPQVASAAITLAIDHPLTTAADRQACTALRSEWRGLAAAAPAEETVGFDTLVHRLAETGGAELEPLASLLRGPSDGG